MNLDFINRIVKTSVILSLVLLPFLIVYLNTQFGAGYVLGCLWGCLNLLAIKFLITRAISPDTKNKTMIILFSLLKFPVIYFLGYLLIIWEYPSLYGLVWGFSSLFAVTLLKVASKAILDKKTNIQVKAL